MKSGEDTIPLPQYLLRWARERPHVTAIRQKREGIWKELSWEQYAETSRAFGAGLIRLGIAPGDKIAIISENRQEWVLAQLGAF